MESEEVDKFFVFFTNGHQTNEGIEIIEVSTSFIIRYIVIFFKCLEILYKKKNI